MTEQESNELRNSYTKDILANMIKADIRQRFPEPQASLYCKQFDDFKNVLEFFDYIIKQMK